MNKLVKEIGRVVSDDDEFARTLKAALVDGIAELKVRPQSPKRDKELKALEDCLENFVVYSFTKEECGELAEGLLQDQPVGRA
jgi:hypothetical protein